MKDLATVTITVRDDPASKAGVNVVIESDPPYALLHPGGEVDVDAMTNAQAMAWFVVLEAQSHTVTPDNIVTVEPLDLPDTPPE